MTAAAAAKLDLRNATRMFKALGDETRLRIVALLSHGELCVCHVEEALRLSQPNASRALGILLNAGLVERRRSGNWVYFKLATQADELCQRQLKDLVRSFGSQELLRRDIERLLKVRGPGACS
jgi:ArsR family transcriptional regulator